jgi:glycosyltransferase involved in cell wall biosynthesis
MPPHHVLICLPTYNEEVHINFAFSLLDLTRALTDSGSTYETLHVASSHIIRARNFFANYFLSRPEFTHLLFLDTDMKFPAEAVLKLLAANKTVAGVAYPFRRFDLDRSIAPIDTGLTLREWLEKHADYTFAPLTNKDGDMDFVNGFAEARHIGTGVFLAQREAFEATKPFTECYAPPAQFKSMIPSGKFYGFFETIEEDGVYLGEDVSFCNRARQAGLSIWALIDQTVVHYGMSEVSGQYLQAMRRRGKVT